MWAMGHYFDSKNNIKITFQIGVSMSYQPFNKHLNKSVYKSNRDPASFSKSQKSLVIYKVFKNKLLSPSKIKKEGRIMENNGWIFITGKNAIKLQMKFEGFDLTDGSNSYISKNKRTLHRLFSYWLPHMKNNCLQYFDAFYPPLFKKIY